MLKEFKQFIQQGNVMDLAVGVIIGAAFGKIVTSLVDDMIMPLVGMLFGKVDFANMFFVLSDGAKSAGPYESLAKAKEAGASVIAYGQFINTIVQFVIVAFAIFMMVKAVNKMRKQPEPAPDAPPPADIALLTEIRDLLRSK